jgi:hypothetical protein
VSRSARKESEWTFDRNSGSGLRGTQQINSVEG